MEDNYWFSCDVDTGEVVAKTAIQDDGTINRYEYTKPDDIKAGHGDIVYDSYDDFVNDNPNEELSRSKDDESSIYRFWSGNGFNLGINDVDYLSSDFNNNSNIYTSFDLLNYNAKSLKLKR